MAVATDNKPGDSGRLSERICVITGTGGSIGRATFVRLEVRRRLPGEVLTSDLRVHAQARKQGSRAGDQGFCFGLADSQSGSDATRPDGCGRCLLTGLRSAWCWSAGLDRSCGHRLVTQRREK